MSSKLIRIIFLIIFDLGSIWFIRNAISLGFDQLVVVIAVIAVMNTLIFLIPKAYPYRWMAVGLSFMILFIIYPMLFTIYVAFTNYGDGHLLTKEQAIPLIEKATYLPEAGQVVFMDRLQIPLWRLCPLADRTRMAKASLPIQARKSSQLSAGDPGIGDAGCQRDPCHD